jgi:2'-5' RNA ligase
MEYILTVRVSLPQRIREVIAREKNKFVRQYGSSYTSEPHITLYLGRYTKQGFRRFVQDAHLISIRPFTIALRKPKAELNKSLKRRFFFLDVSGKEKLYILHLAVLRIAARYRSPLIRTKDQKRLRKRLYDKRERSNLHTYGYAHVLDLFKPHITLGEVEFGKLQPGIASVRKSLRSLQKRTFLVSNIVAILYQKESKEKSAKTIRKTTIRLG